jgi:predicted permease
LSSLRLSPTREAEVVEELSQHLDDRWRELIGGGASAEEATRVTLDEFRQRRMLSQNMAALRQAHSPSSPTPGAPTGHILADVWQDARHALRMFSKQPAFAAAAVLTLALGIGASTAIFSVVYGVLLKPLPFDQPENLVTLLHRAPGINLTSVNQGPATYLTYLDNQRAFEAIGAWESNQVSITGRGDPEQVEALAVTHTTLGVLRTQPVLGRFFSKEDDAPGGPPRAVLSHGYWQRRFGGARNVIGQVLEVDGTPSEVIGVLPSSFKFLRTDPAILLPMQLDRASAFRGIEFDFQAVARLKPGVLLSHANADVARMIPLLPRTYETLQLQPNVRPLADDVIGDIGRVLWILLAAVGIVLLIACGNAANLFLIRAERRQQEFAVRAALGASRTRIAQALLAESVTLALAGGAVGLGLAHATVGLLQGIAPAELPRVDEIGIDATVLSFTVIISVLSGALFGLFAVLKFGSPGVTALKEGGRSAGDGPGRHRTRNALVVAQIALALILTIVSGLMIRTFLAMRQVDPGFVRPEGVQTFRIAIPERLIDDEQQVARTHESIARRLEQVPGVSSVGLSSSITMDGEDNGNPLFVEHLSVAEGQLPPLRRFKSFAPGYFETMGNRLVAGRSLTWTDIYQRQPVVVISETLAREYWTEPARALGKRVRGFRPTWYEIVGVSGNERDDGLNQPPTAIVYWPMLNDVYQERTVAYAVRSSRVGTPGFLRELQQAVWSVNSSLPLAAVQPLDAILSQSMAQTSFAMTMLGIAAGIALLLGVVGIYGAIAYIVAQRTREIGLRIALGAQAGDVQRMFLRHGLSLTAVGVALGVGVALVLTRVMSALLFGIGPTDLMTYAAVSGILAAVALLATYLPARRASSVDPMVALRAETGH